MSDLISRESAIDALRNNRLLPIGDHTAYNRAMRDSEKVIRNLPFAEFDLSEYSDKLWQKAYEQGKAAARPERIRGQWKPFDLTWGRSIYACSACGKGTDVPTEMGTPIYKYCPHCGADMREQDGTPE